MENSIIRGTPERESVCSLHTNLFLQKKRPDYYAHWTIQTTKKLSRQCVPHFFHEYSGLHLQSWWNSAKVVYGAPFSSFISAVGRVLSRGGRSNEECTVRGLLLGDFGSTGGPIGGSVAIQWRILYKADCPIRVPLKFPFRISFWKNPSGNYLRGIPFIGSVREIHWEF